MAVYVEMGGRCGNQLFHYATARYIQIKNNDDKLILNFNSIFAQNKKNRGWYDVLEDFNTVPYEYYDKPGTVLKNETTLVEKIPVMLKSIDIWLYKNKPREERAVKAQRFQKLLNKFNVYWVREGVTKIYPTGGKSIVTGVCESYEIFDEIGDILREELQPIHEVEDRNITLIRRITNSNSICVSVRRGDFFNTQFEKSFGVCTVQYYYNAVDTMKKLMKDSTFFVFSDDINWCKENLRFNADTVYVPHDMPVYETLRLMYTCKHFIISNSTYSWWGQYLSRNKEKIVISPSRWNNDGYHSRLIDKSWILIDT